MLSICLLTILLAIISLKVALASLYMLIGAVILRLLDLLVHWSKTWKIWLIDVIERVSHLVGAGIDIGVWFRFHNYTFAFWHVNRSVAWGRGWYLRFSRSRLIGRWIWFSKGWHRRCSRRSLCSRPSKSLCLFLFSGFFRLPGFFFLLGFINHPRSPNSPLKMTLGQNINLLPVLP